MLNTPWASADRDFDGGRSGRAGGGAEQSGVGGRRSVQSGLQGSPYPDAGLLSHPHLHPADTVR